MESNKLNIKVVRELADYIESGEGINCIFNNRYHKDRNINYKLYGIMVRYNRDE